MHEKNPKRRVSANAIRSHTKAITEGTHNLDSDFQIYPLRGRESSKGRLRGKDLGLVDTADAALYSIQEIGCDFKSVADGDSFSINLSLTLTT
jgi:hypothetical protein